MLRFFVSNSSQYLVYNYKYKKAKIVVNTDMCLNELIPNSKNVICLFQNNSKFCMYGTSWKSTDFQPGSKERPIHKIFFNNDTLIFECLNLQSVPNGEYYWFAFPLPLEGASESPVCPVLLTKQELTDLL